MNQIVNGLNSKDGVYLKIGTEAFRTTDEKDKIIRCTIGKGSNPWKYNYFTNRQAGYKWLGIDKAEETKAEVKVEDISNYDKEAILKVNPEVGSYGWRSYGMYGKKEQSFIEREKYLDSLSRITIGNSYKIQDLSDLFYYLIIKRTATSNCDHGRARTADDLYLLAKYQFKIDITFEECFKILCLVTQRHLEFHPNFGISISWCTTVNRIVTGPNFPQDKTKDDFRQFFNKLKVNKNVVINGS